MTLIGSYHTASGGYGGRYRLDDGTEANVTTEFAGTGLEAATAVEADRPLTAAEVTDLADADAQADHGTATTSYQPKPTQASW